MSQNTYYWLPDAGVLPLNDTNFGAGVINPRKGDSSCYPRVPTSGLPAANFILPIPGKILKLVTLSFHTSLLLPDYQAKNPYANVGTCGSIPALVLTHHHDTVGLFLGEALFDERCNLVGVTLCSLALLHSIFESAQTRL